MKSFNFKKLISFALVITMVISAIPFNALALESNQTTSENAILDGIDSKPFEETVLLKEIKANIANYLDKYLGTLIMSEDAVKDAVSKMDYDTQIEAWFESDDIRIASEELTDAEAYFLVLYEATETFAYMCNTLDEIMLAGFELYAATGTHTPIDGVTVSVSGASDNSMSDGAVTVTAKGSNGFFGMGASAKTATITISNLSDATSTLSFNWSATSVNELKIDGTVYGGTSGSFGKILQAGESFIVTITTEKNTTTNKLVMSNFTLVASKAESNVTFNFDSTLGSVTVADNAISNGDVVVVPSSGTTAVATTANGATFLGWIDMATNKIISKDLSCTIKAADDMSVMPVFAKTSPWFIVNSDFLYEGLNSAMTAVAAVANKTVVLANNATLPAGEYTIPAGVTLLIPYDAANTLCTTQPTCVEKGDSENNYVTPSAYRTLTMASGANINVNGAICVSGSQYAGQGKGAGVVFGPVGFIRMESDSSITVNSGANLYVWGYIIGSGAVTIKNGGTVYEDFQVMDWRGGTAVSGMVDNKNRVFPMTQYYVQNVEVPMTLEAGAIENGYMSITVTLLGVQGSSVPFIGPNGMFNITSGSVTKDYDELTDRLVITANGEIQMKSLSVKMNLGIAGTKTINSSKYDLPINSNITVHIANGAKITITQDIALLAGSQLIVDAGAECTLSQGNSIYIYDATEWTSGNFVYPNVKVGPLKYIPGKPSNVAVHNANSDAMVHIAGTIDASQGYVYTTVSGATITAENGAVVKLNPGTKTTTYQAVQNNTDITYTAINIQNVKLGETNNRCGGTYNFTDGAWVKTTSEHKYTDSVTTAAGCETEGVKTFTCPCGDSYTEAIAALGHNEVIDKAVDPTCTATGLTEGKHCDRCDKVLVAQTQVSALGHKIEQHANCTNAGVCTVCGEVLEEALGHSVIVDKAVDPTCTATGLTEGKHCGVCGEVLVAQTEVAALGHKLSQHANCTESGVCTVCGTELEEALGHSVIVDNAVEATCEATGLTEGSHCDRCGEVLVTQIEIPALNHNIITDKAKEPTCEEVGLTEGSHCDRCGKVLVAQQEITALGHIEVIDKSVDATCDNSGLTEGKHCSVCGKVLVAQTQVPALDHDWLDIPAKAPTRTENGYEAYSVCQLCGISTDKVIIPALGQASIESFDDFIKNLMFLEEIANIYVQQYPAKDPIALVIKYIRTGVDRYNSGSWGIMAGSEDADFAQFVTKIENEANASITDGNYVAVTALKDIKIFKLPNGQKADLGHIFGSMDITYHNKYSFNHADVSGWAGDLVDLLEVGALFGVDGTLEEMIETLVNDAFLVTIGLPDFPSFSKEDWDGDMDAYYVMNVLKSVEYGIAYTDDGDIDTEDDIYSLTEIFLNYMTADLDDEYRASYFMTNRLNTNGTRAQVRNAVYNEYVANGLIATLEGTRDLTGAKNLSGLRRAVCYAFADHICKLAGDYVEKVDNPYFNVFDSSSVQLAPGITQEINYATSADGKQMVYYIATGDITRGDVQIYANYANNDPSLGWEMSRVINQANVAQAKRSDPSNPNYIENYNVIASVNADGFDMTTGEPGGLLIMDGQTYHGISDSGFFGITKDGKAVIGTVEDYNNIYKDQLKEAVGGFGSMLVNNGEIAISRSDSYYTNRASRTAIGVTRTGKVVFMVLDGRQEPFSCGGSMEEIAQIMLEAGCVQAINLDGGGSSTFVARQPGDDRLSVVNRPSDGFSRSVSSSLLMVSTAPSSTEFDHAIIESEYKYATIGTPVQMTGKGISPAGNETDIPDGYTWAVSDERFATISKDGVFTGLRNGTVEVYMMNDGEIIGKTEMHVVVPDKIYFTRTHMDVVYGSRVTLPVAANYENKPVAISIGDIKYVLDNTASGTITDNIFVGSESSGIKVVKVTACLANDETVSGVITLNMFKQGENTFDFSLATGGDRQFAWLREVTNSTTEDHINYAAIDFDEKMTTSYIFAIDMTQIPIPAQLADLVYMLPGADAVDASAWNFLLQLAERVSVLTEITATIDFDDNMIVDLSQLTIMNEYFSLSSQEFDERTNTLTLKLNWIDQTKAIDPATANPLCMLKGIKITPKDGAIENADNRLNVVNSGSLSYKGYLRANALYSFASKPENQEIFGLHPFVNPDPAYNGESGAWFGTTYTTFEDSYALAYVTKDGWTMEEGGFAYYVDGEKLTGVNEIDGYYYDFGEKGINDSQSVYTGMFFDKEAGVYRYAETGVVVSGWKQIKGEWYYFRRSTMAAAVGEYVFNADVTYQFENDGRLISGVWVKNDSGIRYYYGPSYYRGGNWGAVWYVIDGDRYCFNRSGYALTGIQSVFDTEIEDSVWYDFGEDGKNAQVYTGPYENYFYINGIKQLAYQLIEFEGYYYYVENAHKLVKNRTIYMNKILEGTGLPAGYYAFDEEGRMIINNDTPEIPETPETPEVEVKNGVYGDYFYIDGVRQNAYQLIEYEGYYYYVENSHKLVKNRTIYMNKILEGTGLPAGYYAFDEEGRMIKNGVYGDYFYIDGVRQSAYQLIEYEGYYYYVENSNKLVKNRTIYMNKILEGTGLPAGEYAFDEEGRMILEQF